MPDASVLKRLKEHSQRLAEGAAQDAADYEDDRRRYESFIESFKNKKKAVIYPALDAIRKTVVDTGSPATISDTDSPGGLSLRLTMPAGARWIEFAVDTTARLIVVRRLIDPPRTPRQIMSKPAHIMAQLNAEEVTSARVEALLDDFLNHYLAAAARD